MQPGCSDQRMREALVDAIKNLPEREQYVMSMYYEHDMNLKEIAAGAGRDREPCLPVAQPVHCGAGARRLREW